MIYLQKKKSLPCWNVTNLVIMKRDKWWFRILLFIKTKAFFVIFCSAMNMQHVQHCHMPGTLVTCHISKTGRRETTEELDLLTTFDLIAFIQILICTPSPLDQNCMSCHNSERVRAAYVTTIYLYSFRRQNFPSDW